MDIPSHYEDEKSLSGATLEPHKTILTTAMGKSRQHNSGAHHILQFGCLSTMEQELPSTRHPAAPHHDVTDFPFL